MSEYNRCLIPRLRVEDKEEEGQREREQLEEIQRIDLELDKGK